MIDRKQLFLNKDLRRGGFYELCIQVCPSEDTRPIQLYNNYFWSLNNVEGPFDEDFNKISVPDEFYELEGVLTLAEYIIPFKIFNIREIDPIDRGSNWFDISFYTTTLDNVFGLSNHHWSEGDSCPEILQNFLLDTMRKLFSFHPFLLAFIDFEISGQYYLDNLKGKLENWTNTKFFIGKANYDTVKEEYRNIVSVVV